ncbi:MAG: response regulator transcription factor [Bacteroidota bacterium]
MIKIAIAEDNAALARAICDNIAMNDSFGLCFVAVNGEELLSQLPGNLPDVILMDINMPVMNGIEATRQVKTLYPDIKIVMLTVFDDGDNIFNSILAGATGYVLKDEKPARLFSAIEEAVEGGAPMSPVIAQKTLTLLRGKIPESVPENNEYHLSKRELEILNFLSLGLDYNQIADKIFISPKTVRKHIENIYSKLQAHNKVEAISIAKKNRLI